MDVRLPDGTVITNVPDNITKADLIARLAKAPAAQKTYDPLADMSPIQRGLAGAGKAVVDMGRGIGQLFGKVSADDIRYARELDAPLMNTTAGKVGNVAGSVAAMVPTMYLPGANTYAGSGLIGAISGLIQPSTSTGEAVANTVLGGAGGVAGQWAGNKLAALIGGPRSAQSGSNTSNVNVGQGNSTASATLNANPTAAARGGSTFGTVGPDPSAGLTPGQARYLQVGRDLGMRVTPGQATGSKVLQQFEAKLESQPVTSGRFFSIKNNNQQVLNRTVADALGEGNVTHLTDDVLDTAYGRMQQAFNAAADDVVRPLDADGFLNSLARLEAEHEGMLAAPLANHPLVNRYLNIVSNGQATGQALNNLQSQLGKAAQTLRRSDPATAQALRDVQNLVLDDLQVGLAPEIGDAFRQARQQYRVFSMLADKPSILNPSTGNVSGANLANALQRTDRLGFALGRNDSPMYQAAHFAQAFKPLVGDSGTATRSPLNWIEAAASVPASMATSAYTSSPAISVANTLTRVGREGIAPGSISPEQANLLRRLLTAGGVNSGTGANSVLFGNPE